MQLAVIDEPSRQFSLHLFGLVTLSSFLRADVRIEEEELLRVT